ncbi:PREDICTED: protein ALWAYS EARLY 2-like isoform X2 [Brassica oleracea var. oleracea]|uniref:DIRP domain-containing protein n=1 Tax=Brassica oleracea var. oleracea TaxID=109376 RepID=A0A0D3AFI5_BRAOL|nr:PREDICTED: protein ALWAYS EARLY 2-like isoform X2 [Brassica oleracea var. oleracea]
MAPTVRKSRSVNKRFTNEQPSPKRSSRENKLRKKLSDKLGSQWTKAELERFYHAYRKYGQDWRRVAAAIRNSRNVEMVEALFNMNKAYLSLPEGTASVAGLIAMMTDHYSVMEGSGSEGESPDVSETPKKEKKRKRAKPQLSGSREEVDRDHPVASSTDGCLKFLKQARANGTHQRATGKRTPRVPVQTSRDDGEGSTPPNKRARKQQLDASDDVERYLELALIEASRRGGGSPKDLSDNSPIKNWEKMSRTRKAQSWVGSSREKKRESDMEEVGEMEVPRKGKRVYKKRVKVEEAEGDSSDDNGGASSATEGLRVKSKRRKAGREASRGTYSPRSPKNIDNKLTSGDEFDALQALAELSASFLPSALMESESSPQVKEERIENDMDEKPSSPEATTSTSSHGGKANSEPDESLLHAISAIGNAVYNRKPKPSTQASTDCNAGKLQPEPTSASLRRKRKPKKLGDESPPDSSQNKSINKKELAKENHNMKSYLRTKRICQGPSQSKQLKTAKELEESTTMSDKKHSAMDVVVSTKQDSDSCPATSPPQKPPNRRKASLKKSLQERAKSSETVHKVPRSSRSLSEQELLLKDELSTYMSYPLARRRCIFEWFYSAIDHPWFAKMEFVDYLNHVGLGHVPRLTRLEWSVIKSSLGRARRFSERFLQEEREKLKQYRESVRKHYTELRTGAREGLPTDLARPLAVGNRVIAIHPITREIHDGKILTVDHSQCNVLFDDLGVELVKDIDCMPSNPLEYMPEGLRRQIDKCLSMKKEAQQSGNPNLGLSVIFPPCGLENADCSMSPSLNQGDMNAPILHGKVSTDTTIPHQTNQSCIIDYSKGREAEIQRALALQHALDEKEIEPEMLEIVKVSKTRAKAMVDAAIKAASSVKEGEDGIKLIQEALDMIGRYQPLRSSIVKQEEEHANGSIEHHHHNPSPSDASKPMANNDFIAQDGLAEKNEAQMPSELITSCVATWIMIQMCTERQYPPADVAQLMDTAVTSLQPRCPQNLPIYREIQMCMGRIKTQIMSLVPS